MDGFIDATFSTNYKMKNILLGKMVTTVAIRCSAYENFIIKLT